MEEQPGATPQSPEGGAPIGQSNTQPGVWPPVPRIDAPAVNPADAQRERERLVAIAAGQRNVCFAVLAGVVAYLIAVAIQARPVTLVVVGVVGIYQIFAIYKLSTALKTFALLNAVLCLIPCVSLLVLLSVIGQATRELTQAGIKVGLMGANPNSIK